MEWKDHDVQRRSGGHQDEKGGLRRLRRLLAAEGGVERACPACGDPYMEDERRNLDRKN
ncbi:MAG: hypothetical protein ACLFS6_01975 [Methanomassiliicoccales archaeon]